LFDIVGCYPRRQIAKENGKSHSVDYLTPLVGFAVLQRKDPDASKSIVTETSMRLQTN
jgi:hypothetical protein